MGGFAFHIDYLVELLNNFWQKMAKNELEEIEHGSIKIKSRRDAKSSTVKRGEIAISSIEVQDFATGPLGTWKQQHLNALQMIQAFGESLPQFMLQTAAAFLDWTSGTAKQCFPGL